MFPFLPIVRQVGNAEYLLRFILSRNLKKNNEVDEKEVYKDKRGVSLARTRYTSFSTAHDFSVKHSALEFVGFLIFKKSVFDSLVNNHAIHRPGFCVALDSTPLDVNLDVIDADIEVFPFTPAFAAHADLNYVNPGMLDNETDNIAIRAFSRVLFKNSHEIRLSEKTLSEMDIINLDELSCNKD